jgi:hypothetical protein
MLLLSAFTDISVSGDDEGVLVASLSLMGAALGGGSARSALRILSK